MTLNLEADDMTLHMWPALEHFCLACNNLPLFLLENIHQLRAGNRAQLFLSGQSERARVRVRAMRSEHVLVSVRCAVCAPGVTTLPKLFYAMTPCPLSTCVFMCHDVTWHEPHDHTAGRLILLICLPHKGPQTHRGPHAACTLRDESIQRRGPPTQGSMASAAAATHRWCAGFRMPCLVSGLPSLGAAPPS